MPENTDQQVRKVFCEVLEGLAFMFGDSVDKTEVPSDELSCIEASIRYTGPSAGALTLLAPSLMAGELAANLLGADPAGDDVDELARDALGELMNITMGHLLTVMAGDTPVFDLSPPEVREAAPDRWRQVIESPATVAFVVEDSPVLLQFVSDDGYTAG